LKYFYDKISENTSFQYALQVDRDIPPKSSIPPKSVKPKKKGTKVYCKPT